MKTGSGYLAEREILTLCRLLGLNFSPEEVLRNPKILKFA